MSGIRNLMSFDFKSDGARLQKDFIQKENQIKLIKKVSNLLQTRVYRYNLPSLEKFRRSLQCYCSKQWPGSNVKILAMHDEKLLEMSNKGRRGLDVRITYPKESKLNHLTITGIQSYEDDGVKGFANL